MRLRSLTPRYSTMDSATSGESSFLDIATDSTGGRRPKVSLKTTLKASLLTCSFLAAFGVGETASAQSSNASTPYQSSAEFTKYAQKLRESALLKMDRLEPRVQLQTSRRTPSSGSRSGGRYPWKTNIVTTVFWVGEKATARNPVANHASSWDPKWAINFGGYDDPDPKNRRGYLPAKFIPQQNPFYVALPYNDVTRGTTKPEARFVIPWFNREFERVGKSVCKGRWIAIRHGNRICYAQWEDCGPFRTDHWQYVFGNERPKPNINSGAGLDVSPAVRDYLGLKSGKDVCDWKFVEFHEVPHGPWALYGSNNHFVMNGRGGNQRLVDRKTGGDTGTPLRSQRPNLNR